VNHPQPAREVSKPVRRNGAFAEYLGPDHIMETPTDAEILSQDRERYLAERRYPRICRAAEWAWFVAEAFRNRTSVFVPESGIPALNLLLFDTE
jgi:hypothetical protein